MYAASWAQGDGLDSCGMELQRRADCSTCLHAAPLLMFAWYARPLPGHAQLC